MRTLITVTGAPTTRTSWIVRQLGRLQPRRTVTCAPRQPAAQSLDQASADQLFAEALRADSHVELDWLQLAAQLPGAAERRYCLERALTINPQSELIRAVLAAIGE
jgi:hypothetical protein